MPHVAIIGGGPAGLSAALVTAKNGLETTVFDTGETAMYYARLSNYLGIDTIDGEQFVERARRRVREYGVDFRVQEVIGVERHGSEFTVMTDEIDYAADYVVLATGGARGLASDLLCERTRDGTIAVDRDGATSTRGVYAVGEISRGPRVLAVISAGDGAAAALAILARETKDRAFHDFDTLEDFAATYDSDTSDRYDRSDDRSTRRRFEAIDDAESA